VALNKTKLRREIQAAHRQAFKLRLGELRELIKAARVARREAIRGVKLDCAQKRIEARTACQLRALHAKTSGAEEIARRKSKLLDEAGFEKKMRKVERPHGGVRSTARERAQESDDEVRSNLEPGMVRVFNAVRKHIKGNARKSRTEAFLQWAEENPEEVFTLLQHDADKYLAQLLAEQAQTERQMKRRSAVPF
jgi:hypothetical protein